MPFSREAAPPQQTTPAAPLPWAQQSTEENQGTAGKGRAPTSPLPPWGFGVGPAAPSSLGAEPSPSKEHPCHQCAVTAPPSNPRAEQSPCCGAAYTILQAPSSSVPSSPNTARNTGRENEHFGNNYCSTYPLPCKKEMQSHPQHLPWAGTQAPAFPSPPLWILGRKGEARTGVLASYNPTAALPSTAPTQGQLLMFRRINYSP